jgi:hypothetical protein
LGTPISTANAINSIVDQSDSTSVASRIVSAIQSASTKTGVDFSYLMNKASQESSFDPSAKATTSSATGLFQFTSQTWLHMVKTYGDQYGLGNYAAQITADADGHLSVSNSAARQAILALRKDPSISAEMAGELDKENAAALEQKVGGKIGGTELYLAHFLGAGGASNFIHKMRSNPQVAAADVLPTAAAANPSVFYTKSGEPRSLQQIYQHFAQKFDSGSTRMASVTPKASTVLPYSVASSSQIAINLASMMPTANAATTQATSAANMTSTLRSQSTAGGMTLASADSSLFNTMVLGQVQKNGLSATSALAAFNQAGGKKKNPYLALASAA